ncbi:MAG: hypothetical protein V7K21_16430 [Nostoc sp.]|uniref:hypothetical protein n=1 Tax=Nostoc sp. TaxID=1180 RepID=UPI002FF4E579
MRRTGILRQALASPNVIRGDAQGTSRGTADARSMTRYRFAIALGVSPWEKGALASLCLCGSFFHNPCVSPEHKIPISEQLDPLST